RTCRSAFARRVPGATPCRGPSVARLAPTRARYPPRSVARLHFRNSRDKGGDRASSSNALVKAAIKRDVNRAAGRNSILLLTLGYRSLADWSLSGAPSLEPLA